MSGVVSKVRDGLEEVVQGAGRVSRRAAGQIILAGALAVVAAGGSLAQSGPVTIETAGKVAAELCRSRGDTSINCIRLERNRLVEQIGDQARLRIDNLNAERVCISELERLRTGPNGAQLLARGQIILNGKRPTEFVDSQGRRGLCAFLRELTQP